MTDNPVIYVEGVGPIGQYYSYIDTYWSKGIPYFLRDVYFQELESLLELGHTAKSTRKLVGKINYLNKRILEFEANREKILTEEAKANEGRNKG